MKQTKSGRLGLDQVQHLTSILDLSAQLNTRSNASELLQLVVLSVMGRLGISRALALLPSKDKDGWSAVVGKGLSGSEISNIPQNVKSLIYSEFTDSSQILTESFPNLGIATSIPLVFDGRLLAILFFGPTLVQRNDDSSVSDYLRLIQLVASMALNNIGVLKSLIQTTNDLRSQNLAINTMYEVSRDLTVAKSKKELLRIVAYHLMGRLLISSFAMIFKDKVEGEQAIYTTIRDEDLEKLHPQALALGAPVRVNDLSNDEELKSVFTKHGVQLASPMKVNGVSLGTIVTRGKLNGEQFTHNDLTFLEAVGNAAMAAIENDRMQTAEMKVKNEMIIARSIQTDLLPAYLPNLPGVELASFWKPTHSVGGDYFDVIETDDEQVLFAIADVAGKGVPAAILMANAQAALTILARMNKDLTDVAGRVNRLLVENTKPEVFVTMFLACYKPSERALEYVCMGHNPPIYICESGIELLSEGGVLAGLLADPPPYRSGTKKLSTGDVVIMYTDGVTETQNVHGDEFGMDRLLATAERVRGESAEMICASILTDIEEFGGDAAQTDDVTLLIVRVL